MAQNNATNDSVIDDKYNPIYEYDPDAGPSYLTTGQTVCQVPREPQVDALKEIAGEGAVEPDGWFEGYNGMAMPVLDGVPIAIFEHSRTIKGGSEGAESWTSFAVDDSLGPVKIQRAGRHPDNVSKIKVSEKKDDDR